MMAARGYAAEYQKRTSTPGNFCAVVFPCLWNGKEYAGEPGKIYYAMIDKLLERCEKYDKSPRDPAYFQDFIDGDDSDIGSSLYDDWWLKTVLYILKMADLRGCFDKWDREHPIDHFEADHNVIEAYFDKRGSI